MHMHSEPYCFERIVVVYRRVIYSEKLNPCSINHPPNSLPPGAQQETCNRCVAWVEGCDHLKDRCCV